MSFLVVFFSLFSTPASAMCPLSADTLVSAPYHSQNVTIHGPAWYYIQTDGGWTKSGRVMPGWRNADMYRTGTVIIVSKRPLGKRAVARIYEEGVKSHYSVVQEDYYACWSGRVVRIAL